MMTSSSSSSSTARAFFFFALGVRSLGRAVLAARDAFFVGRRAFFAGFAFVAFAVFAVFAFAEVLPRGLNTCASAGAAENTTAIAITSADNQRGPDTHVS